MSPASSPADASAADSAWPRVGQREQDGRQWTVASGRWTTLAMSSKPAWQALSKSLEAAPAADDRAWDLRPVEQLDHIGAQLLWEHWHHQWPTTLEMEPQHKAVLDQVAQYTVATPDEPAPTLIDRIRAFSHNGRHRTARRGATFSGHLYQFGATALPITALVGG
jgi:phospholipid/cholesterol/gamma-HCH transport system permease protein